MSERGLLYISEKPLTGDYEKDEQYKVLAKHWYHDLNAGDVNGGKNEIHLEKGKKYYIRLVVNNADKPSVCVPGQNLCRSQTGGDVFFKEVRHGEWLDDSNITPETWFAI